ncbi:[protein-PII] uridylyltransferase [Ferrigenium sp. UT5]|uniref:[protein-PII] uridylyltransferase n=1 Tax=Ferrigenium sp. UT5 TaxID=3242105 RepID=UPI00354B24CD
MQTLAGIKESLRRARQTLLEQYAANPNPARYLRDHTRAIDEHLRLLWRTSGLPDELALVAVGGYGRAELYPRSDVDLLILLPRDADGALQQRLQELVGQWWDIGLEVGHSVRTVAQCIDASADITVQTNLLEARLVDGSRKCFAELLEARQHHLDVRAFYLGKQQEQNERYRRYTDIDFNLEPNLKESPGGLRDLHSVLWIARAAGLGHTWHALAQNGLLTASEARQAQHHQRLLQDMRIRLHQLCGRHDDRLVFDYQQPLAQQLHIAATPQLRASERMMRRYYRTKREIQLLNDVLMQTLRARLFPQAETRTLNRHFIARGDKLGALDDQLFERVPGAILESFLLLQQHPELTGFSAATVRALWRARRLIGPAFRADPANRERFMRILLHGQGLTHGLRRMNQMDILGRYLPAFGRIVGQMQHDLFHVYTVDEHILMVVRNLRRASLPEYAHEFPLSSRLIGQFEQPHLLYLAGLFHDIAKGRGGDHSLLGRRDVVRFCHQHGIAQGDMALIVWLVEHHLLMSATAQKQDLTDQDVIAAFAARIPDERHLTALYLLTVADVRGTSPKVWNAWKGKLLEDLYQATRHYLAHGRIADQIGATQSEAAALLSLYAIQPESYRPFWSQLDDDYFIQHEAQEIAWHTRVLARLHAVDKPAIKTRLSRIGEGLQVLIFQPDQPYLFARICNFFARMNYNIMEAKVHTTRLGFALDSFLVMDASNDKTAYRDVMNYIEYALAEYIGDAKTIPEPAFGRQSRQLKHFPITPEVDIRRNDKGHCILSLVAGDRPGLLARIAYLLTQHQVTIRSAKINTLGARAEDTFWLGCKELPDHHAIQTLRDALLHQLK